MKVVIPLAGPDFERGSTTKAEEIVEGEPLLKATLESRAWWRDQTITDSDVIFVLQGSPLSRNFAEATLSKWYPRAKMVFLPGFTSGAALSALAGVSCLDQSADEPLCIDLVDILYTADCHPEEVFSADPSLGGLALTFESSQDIYSYLRLGENGLVIEAAEKKVISSHASAGTYFFRNGPTYVAALSHCLSAGGRYTHKGLHFVCPLYNGVIANNQKVRVEAVSNVRDVKQCD